jgi:hypothetical protein
MIKGRTLILSFLSLAYNKSLIIISVKKNRLEMRFYTEGFKDNKASHLTN